MSSTETTEIPVGYAEASKQLEAKLGGRSRCYQSMSYRVLGVSSLYVEERHYGCMVRNPRYTGLRKLFEPEYIRGSQRGLSNLYIDGAQHGPLHGGSEGMANGIQGMLANTQKPADLIIMGHFTEAGWFIDSIRVEKAA